MVSYKTYARRETHPTRLGALGRLLGIAARDLAGARVLELGCGNGRNIIPLAEANPSTRFIGVDRATDLIEAGRRECAELGIENVELIAADIANYNPPVGEMDYVLCHGVYSWVSEVLQRRILDVIKKALAPNGIAVVSYNTLPGWHQRGVVRDIIRVGSLSAVADTEEERCDAGMKLLAALAKEPALSSYVRESAVRLEQSEASYIAQEFLADCNTPQLFIDFMRAAQDCGLQYMSEARVVMMSTDDLSDETRKLLDSYGADVWLREQVLDFIRNRTFRETLLCHEGVSLTRGLKLNAFKELTFTSNYLPSAEDAPGDKDTVPLEERFSRRLIYAPRGECEKVIRALSAIGVQGAKVGELSERVRSDAGLAEEDTLRALVTLWKSGFVDALLSPLCGLQREPTVTQLAVSQAKKGERVTSVLHESLSLTALERKAIEIAPSVRSFEALELFLLQSVPRIEAERCVQKLREWGFFR